MLAKLISAAVIGLEARPIEIEVDISRGLPGFSIVGLPDKAIEESKERIRSAILNSGGNFPDRKIIVNLAPADLKKEGPAYDLPIALGILLASSQICFDSSKTLFLGELALDGKLRHVKGVLPIILMAKKEGFEKIFLPASNLLEAKTIEGLNLYPLNSLEEAIFHFRNEKIITPIKSGLDFDFNQQLPSYSYDMAYIKGQEHAKRALEIAAAGGHNILLIGSPGAGKTLLARTLPSILPKLTLDEAIEITKIYSVAGLLSHDQSLILERPFRAPHHTSSDIALVGGGTWPKPGEISLAHKGVLFLDELPEFPRSVLEALRQPLEDGIITISRATGSLTFPASFILVAASNPCPCGFLFDPVKECRCSSSQIAKYQKKLSGPLLDRIDLYVEVPPVKYEKLVQEELAESSEVIRERVQKARDFQTKRFKNERITTNSEMGVKEIKKYCQLDEECKKLLQSAIESLHLSARVFHRIIKISRTIADLSGEEKIKPDHIAEALSYRPKEQF